MDIDQLEVVYLHRGAPNDLKRIYGREIVHIGKSFLSLKIEALSEVPEVDGPSAGALMTTLIIAALENITLPDDVTMTGTISPDGHIGEIEGIMEKAKAAKEDNKRIFILPRENSRLVRYEDVRKQYGGITIIKQNPAIEDTKEYIEKNIGIHVEYVDSIKDVMDIIY